MKKLSFLFISLTIFIYSCSSNDDDDTTTLTTKYILTITSGEGGTVSTQGGTYDEGTVVTVTATPNEGFVFTGWSNGSKDYLILNFNIV